MYDIYELQSKFNRILSQFRTKLRQFSLIIEFLLYYVIHLSKDFVDA